MIRPSASSITKFPRAVIVTPRGARLSPRQIHSSHISDSLPPSLPICVPSGGGRERSQRRERPAPEEIVRRFTAGVLSMPPEMAEAVLAICRVSVSDLASGPRISPRRAK